MRSFGLIVALFLATVTPAAADVIAEVAAAGIGVDSPEDLDNVRGIFGG